MESSDEWVSESGGWNRKELAALGVPWPPPRGWKKELMKKREKILQAARKKAGMPQLPKVDVIRYVCDRLRVPMPPSWDLRYKLMREWAMPESSAPVVNVKHFQPIKPPQPTSLPVPVRGEARRRRKAVERAQRDEFLLTYEWRRLRMEVLKERGRRCECCGIVPSAENGAVVNVDHVKPRKLHPELALEKSNLQVLCDACNHGKGNWDETDWRTA